MVLLITTAWLSWSHSLTRMGNGEQQELFHSPLFLYPLSSYQGYYPCCIYLPSSSTSIIEVMPYLMTMKASLSNPGITLINISQWVIALLPALFSAGIGFFRCGRCWCWRHIWGNHSFLHDHTVISEIFIFSAISLLILTGRECTQVILAILVCQLLIRHQVVN